MNMANEVINGERAINMIGNNQARVNVTYAGSNGDLPDPVARDAADGDVKTWLTEALRTGGIPGIPVSPDADLREFVVDRFDANEARPFNLIQVRPKTPFGGDFVKAAGGRLVTARLIPPARPAAARWGGFRGLSEAERLALLGHA